QYRCFCSLGQVFILVVFRLVVSGASAFFGVSRFARRDCTEKTDCLLCDSSYSSGLSLFWL
ncbi:hypothetical protein IJT10_04995, partial [bacterium]|nr:hypothetical protein [bacterium]